MFGTEVQGQDAFDIRTGQDGAGELGCVLGAGDGALHAWQNELSYYTVEELAEWHPELRDHEPLSIAEVDGLLWRLYAAASPREGGKSSVSTVSTVSTKGGR